MAATVAAPRYSAEDFETTSIRSAAPSYASDAPSYHSNLSHQDTLPPYTPPENRNTSASTSNSQPQARARPAARQQTIGLPPLPPATPVSASNLHNFRIPTWSTRNAPAARQLHSVVERRVNNASVDDGGSSRRNMTHRHPGSSRDHGRTVLREDNVLRPLEDPYLVGERAAELAKRERLARERGEDVLQKEDKDWDWMLEQMKSWEARERSFSRFRREVDTSRRGKLLRRMGGRMA
ncbi:hypothetical protein ACRE_029640 [Hapsidospora chrysogenum ATCC 11550]|uniref:Uncharacterized protein n=1 Tax=Hapsidospora chrysogenum (strain ATCC 11550 / CBS 779.69 / DSM 880 / IAM 14645 / JCM 23072 / IMI 49137) TaxID=857340 RepID=A0A086T9V9_HAPC1|nr:hypothetical protein ACRE_029640 [Hapsidospora chrysogenum ATCC 11550]